jgi:hypothetical protein
MPDSKKGAAKSAAASARGSLKGAVSSGMHKPTQEEIQLRAYEIHMKRGGKDGNDLDHWLQAELELKQEQPKKARKTVKTD